MVLTQSENKKIKMLNEKIIIANKRIEDRYKLLKKISDDSYNRVINGNDIDIDNINTDDEKLIYLINHRNKLRDKYNQIASRIWDEKYKEVKEYERL